MTSSPLSTLDIETLERATLAAVAPETLEELDGWLLPCSSGTISRATSAVPLAHTPFDAVTAHSLIDRIEARYQARGLPAVFRLADSDCFDMLRAQLSLRGYASGRAVWVQVGSASAMRAVTCLAPADISTAPDAAWAALFVGEGFDPAEGASRVRSLSRASGSLYASVREHGQTVAAGAGAFSHGWASVHGMRTHPAYRGQGLAGRVLAGLATATVQKGVERVFLQVEDGNDAALALYRRAGFMPVWRYAYWRRLV